jgi:hypothetical protein
MRTIGIAALALATASCTEQPEAPANGVLPPGPATNASAIETAAIPAGVRAIVDRHVPGMAVAGAARKEREGRIYYDVEGTRPGGSEVELDVLQEGDRFSLVEIQRDIAWADAPTNARAAAAGAPDAFAPERVIESTQADGSIVYELFAPGKPKEPAMEVQVRGGKAELLAKRSAH